MKKNLHPNHIHTKVKLAMTKICKTCQVPKIADFHFSIGARVCKQCKNLARAPKRPAQMLKARYGITMHEYDALLKRQDNKCAVCFKAETSKHQNGKIKRLAVDHDHKTGKVRGLLCKACNQSLGLISENIDTALGLVEYIQLHKKNTKYAEMSNV